MELKLEKSTIRFCYVLVNELESMELVEKINVKFHDVFSVVFHTYY